MSKILLALALCAALIPISSAHAKSKKGGALSIIMEGDDGRLKPKIPLALAMEEPLSFVGTRNTTQMKSDTSLKVTRRNPIDCDENTCMYLNSKGRVEYHSAGTLQKTKPTKAEIASWSSPAAACPSEWFAKYMERLGYPHRKDCDKLRRKTLFERYQGIDTGGVNSPYRRTALVERPLPPYHGLDGPAEYWPGGKIPKDHESRSSKKH